MRIRDRNIIILFSRILTRPGMLILGIILNRSINKETLGTYRHVLLVYSFFVVLTLSSAQPEPIFFIKKISLMLINEAMRPRFQIKSLPVSLTEKFSSLGLLFNEKSSCHIKLFPAVI